MYKPNYESFKKKARLTYINYATKLINDGVFDNFVLKVIPEIVTSGNKNLYYLNYTYYLQDSPYQSPFFSYLVNKEGDIISNQCEFCYNEICGHVLGAVKLQADKEQISEDQINILFKEEEIRLETLKVARLREASMEWANKLVTNISQQESLALLTPVDLDVIIFITTNINSEQECYYLSLKIGQEKKYVVKKIEDFMNAVRKNAFVKYGQKLAFTHQISNFTKRAQDLIIALLKYDDNEDAFNYLDKGKYFSINKFLLDEILELYRNQRIFIFSEKDINNGKEYLVSLNEYPLHFILNKDYQIKLKEGEHDNLLFGYHHDYIANENQLDIVKLDNDDLRPLLNFTELCPNFSFKYIKDVLNKQIMGRYYSNIEIDPSIASEFIIKDYRIEAYFDYVDETIGVTTKFFCDNEEVTIDNLADEVIANKITRYQYYLTALGFDDKGKLTDPVKINAFLRTNLSELKKVATIYLSEQIKNTQIKSLKKFKMHLSYNVNILDICFEDLQYSDEELVKIIKAIRKKSRYVKLNKDTIVEIDEKTGEEILNTVDEFGLDINHLNKEQHVPLYLALKLADHDLDVIEYATSDELIALIKEIANYKKAPYNPPKELVEKMRPYQIEAYKWMKTLMKFGFSGILADDMGLGKTLEMISVILDDEEKKPSLIVCPKSLCYNWRNEFFMWAPNIEIVNVIGLSNERKELIEKIEDHEKKIYITSYDSLRNDIQLYENKKFRFMILDEGQYIKNHDTLKAQSVKVIASKVRFVLTGTPIENSVLDLWSIFDFIMPNYLGNYYTFKETYEKEVTLNTNSKIIKKLILKITPFILRRTKKDVIKNLPDKIELTLSASMDKAQRAVYEAELLRTKEILLNPDNNKILILACLTRLRQICVDPHLYIDNYQGPSCKLELLMEQLQDYINTNHRVVIFSQFTSIFEKLSGLLKQAKYRHFILTGSTPAKERVMMATSFNENPEIKVFLVSLKAGGTGLNLIGADIVIHLDPWWNLAAQNQATDRTHRIGQKNVVQVVKLICENSIEQKVIELQNRKKEIVDKLVADDDTNISNLSKEDLSYIIN